MLLFSVSVLEIIAISMAVYIVIFTIQILGYFICSIDYNPDNIRLIHLRSMYSVFAGMLFVPFFDSLLQDNDSAINVLRGSIGLIGFVLYYDKLGKVLEERKEKEDESCIRNGTSTGY